MYADQEQLPHVPIRRTKGYHKWKTNPALGLTCDWEELVLFHPDWDFNDSRNVPLIFTSSAPQLAYIKGRWFPNFSPSTSTSSSSINSLIRSTSLFAQYYYLLQHYLKHIRKMRFFTVIAALSVFAVVFAAPIANPEPEAYIPWQLNLSDIIVPQKQNQRQILSAVPVPWAAAIYAGKWFTIPTIALLWARPLILSSIVRTRIFYLVSPWPPQRGRRRWWSWRLEMYIAIPILFMRMWPKKWSPPSIPY